MISILNIAISEIGVKEVPGKKSNPKILQYAKDLGFDDYIDDDVAWCSLFMNWVAHKAGLEKSGKLNARSWLNAGIPIVSPEPGDVVVFWRESRSSWKGHVGIYMGHAFDFNRIYCLGGNQGNQVSITAKHKDEILGFRRLRPIGKFDFTNKVLKIGNTGADVVQLQDGLKQLGYNCGTSDGVFGKKTEQALKDFQSSNTELNINGVFDEETRVYLIELLEV
ncbi:TIGR02594 family protein [Formosa sp. S-31]|uniref:C40 family peptidase n=1 Tax=Formosa sp. S-31 TaxID=2790949 RepID=UPI003EC1139D